DALEQLGFKIDGHALNTAFKRFKDIADKKKSVTAMDLEALVTDEMRATQENAYVLEAFDIEASNVRTPHAHVTVKLPTGETAEGSVTGVGAIDAFFSALYVATGREGRLKEYQVS